MTSNKTICEGCLSMNRTLSVTKSDIRILLQEIIEDVDTRALWLCWECEAVIRRFLKLKQQMRRAQKELVRYMLLHTNITPLSRLTTTHCSVINISSDETKEDTTSNDVLSTVFVKVEDMPILETDDNSESDANDNDTNDELHSDCHNDNTESNDNDLKDVPEDNKDNKDSVQLISGVAQNIKVRKKSRIKTKESFNESDDEPLKLNEHKVEPTRKGKEKEAVQEIVNTMASKIHIPEHQRHRIVLLKEKGLTITEIATELGVSRNTVYLWIRRWSETGVIEEIKKTGRPRKTSRQQDENIIRSFQSNGFTHTSAIYNNVSSNTVRRRLSEAGVSRRVSARKSTLTQYHKQLRLQFAETYLNFDFSKVIFADEKIFHCTENGRLSLRRINNTIYDPANVVNYHLSGISVGLWGWMCSSGPGELIEIEGRLNSAGYREILNDVLLPTTRVMFPEERPIILIHDNCPIHEARVCRAWFEENAGRIFVIPFPPRSPDLNPIENLWALMVQAWDRETPRTRVHVINHAMDTWESFRGQYTCENMIKSMRERLQTVIDANGGHTRFCPNIPAQISNKIKNG